VEVPLDQWTRQIAREAGREAALVVVKEHREQCEINGVASHVERHDKQIGILFSKASKQRTLVIALIAFLVGSGALGAGIWGLVKGL
jgi:hypothetical protein